MTEISSGLKGLAKELGIPVVGLCQLNREVEKPWRFPDEIADDPRPCLDDINPARGRDDAP